MTPLLQSAQNFVDGSFAPARSLALLSIYGFDDYTRIKHVMSYIGE